MTPQELRASILQQAIQGKLVEQRPEEGTGEELFQQIQSENQQEEAKAKRRGKKAAIVSSIDQDAPFDIPETWKWVKLGQLGYTNIGLTYSPKDICNDGIVVLRSSNIQNSQMDYEDIVRVSCAIPDNKMCHIGDILICARNGSKRLVGKAALIDKEGMSFGAFMAIFRSICNPYILQVINSAYFRNTLLEDTGTTTINQITQDMLKNVMIPLPPLPEQKRIVAKLEEILPLIDRYETAWNKLEAFNKRFPEDMQKSILQLAIQGKLVEQRSEEGAGEELFQQIQKEKKARIKAGISKKDKPVDEVSEDDIPFDIPDTWHWCRVGDIFDHNTGKAMNASAKKIDKPGSIKKFITTSNLYWDSFDFTAVKEMFFSDDEVYRCTATKNDILMCEGGAYYGRTAIWNYDYDICFQNHVHRLRSFAPIVEKFYYFVFRLYRETGRMQAKGTAMPGLSSVVLHNMIVPLPPLEEQKRIVAKLEEILPLCERLK